MDTNYDLKGNLKKAQLYFDCDEKGTCLSILEDILYEKYKDDPSRLFTNINNRIISEQKKQQENIIKGLSDAVQHASMFMEYFVNGESEEAKSVIETIIFSNNISFVINICKAYFPNGDYGFAPQASRWFFDKSVELILKEKDRYLETGDSYTWAVQYGHIEYIKLIIKKQLK